MSAAADLPRVAVNGLGRIGRALLRLAARRGDFAVVAVNDLAPLAQLLPLIRRDSVHGVFPGAVENDGGKLRLTGTEVLVCSERDPARIPWLGANPRLVVEATGTMSRREQVAAHLREGVDHVLMSANLADADLTVCLGVNEDRLDPASQRVISNASCTTNCMAPVALVLHRAFGLRRGLLTTVHSYTRGQELLDAPLPDARRARAAAINIVPTSTGAARAVGLVLPELTGRLDAQAVRVPVAAVSMVQFVLELDATPSLDEVAAAFREAAAGPLSGILATSDEELVSSDFVGHPCSAIVDLPLLQHVDGGRLLRVVAWYDNEWGYASRLADLIVRLGRGPAASRAARPGGTS
ncbi:MAG TPA: glyceraldehyde 3-phosphate dehydrogenase NAD-binding domain-containing protein [Thermoanaerobaculia bacterium]|nr:glyceraldehyde 3-phosphate dehydrogenase NAD-binding domain-containing protein [Thermoanaerobaculia bacterium]